MLDAWATRWRRLSNSRPLTWAACPLLPSLSVSQLASSLTGWMGLSAAEQQLVLPNLANFGSGPTLFG